MNPINRATALCLMLVALTHCSPTPTADGPRVIVVTIPPLRLLLEPVVGDRADLVALVPPGASPHTYDLRPSDARATANALGLVYAGKAIDGWAAQLETPNRFALISPASDDDPAHNPHFWLDTRAVREVLPALIAALAEWDPDSAERFHQNAKRFSLELDALDREIDALLAPLHGRTVIEFHPSLTPLLARYGIETVGVIEDAPGHEPSARDVELLIHIAADRDVAAIVREPQLPDAPVRALAEATGAPVVELAPIGGVPGRDTYADLLLFNARRLAEAMR